MPIGVALGTAAIGAGAQMYGANQAAGVSNRANAQIQANVKPYLTAGTDALGRISNPNDLMKNFQASPDYNFRMQQGLDAVGTDEAVNGLLRSGGALKGLTRFAQGTAANEFGDWWNRQSGLATMGLTSQGMSANATQTNAANQGNAAIAMGNAGAGFAGSVGDIYRRSGSQPAAASTTASSYGPVPQLRGSFTG